MIKIIAIHQPNFLPWLGYFHKILNCDTFVFLDDTQYSVQSYTQRVQILCQGKPLWLTVPIKKKDHFGQLIKETECDNKIDWKKKHLNTLKANYGRHRFFSDLFPEISKIYMENENSNLCELNIKLIKFISNKLGTNCKFIRSSELKTDELQKSMLLANIVKQCGGSSYLFGSGGLLYHEEEIFNSEDVELIPQNFKHPIYEQKGQGHFTIGLSIIDCIFSSVCFFK